MALPTETLLELFQFVDYLMLVALALSCASFNVLILSKVASLPRQPSFWIHVDMDDIVNHQDIYIELKRDEIVVFQRIFDFGDPDEDEPGNVLETFEEIGRIVAGYHIQSLHWQEPYGPGASLDELLDMIPTLRFANDVRIFSMNSYIRARPREPNGSSPSDTNVCLQFMHRFVHLTRLELNGLPSFTNSNVADFLRDEHLRTVKYLGLSKWSQSHEGTPGPGRVDDILRFCFDFSALQSGDKKTVLLSDWDFSWTFAERVIDVLRTCDRKVTIVVSSGDGWPSSCLQEHIKVLRARKWHYQRPDSNISVFKEDDGRTPHYTFTNDPGRVAKELTEESED